MDHEILKHTEQVEVLDEFELGAGLVGRPKDVVEETLGQETGEDTIGVDVGTVDTASHLTPVALVLVLVDAQTSRGVAGLGSDTQGESEEGSDGSELHFGDFVGKEE